MNRRNLRPGACRQQLQFSLRYAAGLAHAKRGLDPDMRRDLIGIATVAVIVVCSGCWMDINLPNPRVPTPPPLPVQGLDQLQTIAVELQDASGGDPVNGNALSDVVVDKWNSLLRKKHVRFETQPSADASLKIVLLRKTLSCEPSTSLKQKCGIQLVTSSTLTRRDGKQLWSGPEEESKGDFWVGYIKPPEVWKSDIFMGDAAYCLSFTKFPSLLR
jgi:hypothetical protein